MQRLLALAICLGIHVATGAPADAARRSPHLASRARSSVQAPPRRRHAPPRSPAQAATLAAVDDAVLGAGQIALAQELLLRAGWLHGTADGRLTTRTRRALAALQRALHRPGTGALDAATYAILVAGHPADAPRAQATPAPQLAIAPVAPVSPSASAPPRRSPRRHR